MTRKETVKRAIHFQTPGRVPKFFFNGDLSRSDIVMVVCEDWAMGPNHNAVEWGFTWDIKEGESSPMGVPHFTRIEDLDQLDDYIANCLPDVDRADRFRRLNDVEVGDRYLLGSTFLSGFTVMMLLRGFENLMCDLYEEPEQVEKLAEAVFGFENKLIRRMSELGFDGVALFDDWGTQRSLFISPDMWREHFLPHYKKQFALAHSLGMDVFFHTCGAVYPIIGDLIDAGVDMLNLGQIGLNEPERLAREMKGRVCFCQPLDYQKTCISGTKEDIFAEARYVYELLGDERGGFIPEIFDYELMGWQPDDPMNTEYQIQAFEVL